MASDRNGYSCCCWFFPCCCRCRGEAGNKACTGASGGENVQMDNVTRTICTSKPKVDIRGHHLHRAASSLKYGDEASRCRTTVARSFLPFCNSTPSRPCRSLGTLDFSAWAKVKPISAPLVAPPPPLRAPLGDLLSLDLSVASIFHS